MELSPRQEEIIETAMDLITKNGIEGLTIKNIARNIGISEAALYRHFNSKTEILLAILNYFEEKARTLLDSVKDKELSGIEKIFRILKTRCDDFIRNPAAMVVILSEELFPNDSRLSQKVFDIMKMNQQNLLKIIEESQKEDEMRNDIEKEMLFFMIIGPFRFMVTRWRLSNYTYDLGNEFLRYWNALEKMIKMK